MNNSNRREKYSVSVGKNQLVLVLNSEVLLPEDAPVRMTSAQIEELAYRKLYEAYSSRERKSVTDPLVLFKVMAYGYECAPAMRICTEDIHSTTAINGMGILFKHVFRHSF